MDLEMTLDEVFVGGVLRATIRCGFCNDVFRTLKFVSVRMVGVVRINGRKIKFLESVPVQLPVTERRSETVYRCSMPGDSLPSIRASTFEVVYLLVVEVYHSHVKHVESKVFSVRPLGCVQSGNMIRHSAVIHRDMIRVGDGEDTAFSRIVRSLRNGFECEFGSVESVVERKASLLSNFGDFMNRVVEEHESEGDIYFYTSADGMVVDGGRCRAVIYSHLGEIAKVEYSKVLVRDDVVEIFYRRDVCRTRIFVRTTEFMDGEVSKDSEELVSEFNSKMCTYKSVRVSLSSEDYFSFDCVALAVRFSYRIVFDGVEAVLPMKKASPVGRIRIE